MKTKLPVLLALSLVSLFALFLTSCDGVFTASLTLADFYKAPYGYVYDSDGTTPLPDASVVIKKAGTALEDAVVTGSSGYFTLKNKVKDTAGTYTIEVTKKGYSFPVTTITVPSGEYLWNVGSINAKPKNVSADVALTVLDSRSSTHTGVGTVALTLALASDSTKTYTGTTASDGTVTITDVPNGSYKLTGAKSGYFVAPMNVEVAGATVAVSQVQAFTLNYKDVNGLSFIAVWNGSVKDVDIHMSYPTTAAGAGAASSWTSDLYPALPASGRSDMYYAVKDSPVKLGTDKILYMDVDDTDGYGPETMNLIMNTYDWYTADDISRPVTVGSSTYGFPSSVFTPAGTYYFQGTAALYLKAFTTSSNLSDGSAGAEALVYAIQTVAKTGVTSPAANTDVEASLLGIYRVPASTTLASASILNVNMFSNAGASGHVGTKEYFQIVPNIRVVETTTTFRGLGDDVPGIVAVPGRTR